MNNNQNTYARAGFALTSGSSFPALIAALRRSSRANSLLGGSLKRNLGEPGGAQADDRSGTAQRNLALAEPRGSGRYFNCVSAECPPEIQLLPGDVVNLRRAKVRVDGNGYAQVEFKRGYPQDGASAAFSGPVLVPVAPDGVDTGANMALAERRRFAGMFPQPFWFKDQVENGGPWDYKQRSPASAPQLYEPYGNFHYGAAGRANAFSQGELLQGAGWAQQQAGTAQGTRESVGIFPLPATGAAPYRDDAIDQFWIEQGGRYYEAYRNRQHRR